MPDNSLIDPVFGQAVDPNNWLGSRVSAALGGLGANLLSFAQVPGDIYAGKYSLGQINQLALPYALSMEGMKGRSDLLAAPAPRAAVLPMKYELQPVDYNPFADFQPITPQQFMPLKSKAEQLPDKPYFVFDTRNDTGYEGIFPSENSALDFINNHPDKNYLDYGTPRSIEHMNPSGEENSAYTGQEIKIHLMKALGGANEP